MPPTEGKDPRPYWQVVLAALLGGAVAGAATGAIDGLWSWAPISQFLQGFASKFRLVLFLAVAYAFAGAIIATIGASIGVAFLRYTRLGDLVRAAMTHHRRARERSPREAVAGLALVAASIPMMSGALGLAFLWAQGGLAERKHFGLVVAVVILAVVCALVVGALLTFALGRLLELALASLAGTSPGLGRALSSTWAILLVAGALVGIGAGVTMYLTWDTVSLLRTRPIVIAVVWLVMVGHASKYISMPVTRRVGRRGPLARTLTPVATFVVLAISIVWIGDSEGVQKAAGRYSGIGAELIRLFQRAGDLDGDGYSRFLGGGDCDDSDAFIHPQAEDIPDDGIDQNCIGGDYSLSWTTEEHGFATPPALPPDFNVVLITIDTLRADHLGAYGYARKTSPHIDRVASGGTVFENAWAHAPSTRYSIPAIVTGRLPLDVHYDRSVSGWPGLAMQNTTIAEILKDRGLSGGAVLNYWYFDNRHIDQGFDHYDNSNRSKHKQIGGEGPAKTTGSSSKEQTDNAIKFLDKQGSKRFFLWVHYYDPHYAYEMHSEAPDFGAGDIDRYDNEIAFTDIHIGRLLDELKRRGIYEKTVIVITGDHGEGFGEHGVDLHGYHLYAAQTRVPLIIRVPGVKPNRVSSPASHADILPTLANLAGAVQTRAMMGRSLVGQITGAEPPDVEHYVFQQLSFENNNEQRGVISNNCHVIFNVSPVTSWEHYAIDDDPHETRDIARTKCANARRALERFYDASKAPRGAREAVFKQKPSVAKPLDLRFGDEIRLLGVDMPAEAKKRGSFDVTYTFEALGRLRGGWKVFAHFQNSEGKRFQDDHGPASPFAWWAKGQYIRYTRTVAIPKHMKVGTYTLWMGVFKGSDRRPAYTGDLRVTDNRVAVGTIQVVR